jgi:hypothetical protein
VRRFNANKTQLQMEPETYVMGMSKRLNLEAKKKTSVITLEKIIKNMKVQSNKPRSMLGMTIMQEFIEIVFLLESSKTDL